MPRPTVLLDCDPGHDDAIAIAAAVRHTELVAITTVSGNVELAKTTRNALITCQVLGTEVPVHAGADRPLVAEVRHAEFIHGSSGLDGPEHPALEREAETNHAVDAILTAARAHDELWLVATGPLTNVALALRQAPWLAGRLAGISLMGGSRSFGNVTPAAEFNIWADPEAADVVFRSGARLVMAGLDLTHQWMIDEAMIARLRAQGGRAARFVADLLAFYGNAYATAYSGRIEGPLHDPCSVLALSHPELFERREFHVQVELTGNHTRGMTLVDQRGVRRNRQEPNTEVLTRIDASAANELLVETLASYA